jgi:PKHD-type hydroxylase
MLLHVPAVLAPTQLARCRALIENAHWADGRITAGTQSAAVKNNAQLPENDAAAVAARAVVLEALAASALFFTAALPRRIFPPLFNRYGGAANSFGNHIDNAVRTTAHGEHVRTDLSATLFLSAPEDYDGVELVIEEALEQGLAPRAVKLPAGDLALYPSTSVHRVEPVTRGTRYACFFWIESMVRDPAQRRLLFDLDVAVLALRASVGEAQAVVRLTGVYHNLLRMWASP